jgi:RNA polymerase sigma factor (sigma-70 family)
MATEAELEQFMRDHYAALMGYVRRQVPDSEAHDIVQDSLVVVTQKLGEVEKLRGFAFKVASNKVKQYYERRARQAGVLGVLWSEEALSLVPLESLSTRLSIRVARHNDLEHAMQSLSLRQYQAFALRYVEGLTEALAAEALGISRSQLTRDLADARGRLRSALGDGVDDEHELQRIVTAYVRG